MGAKMSVLARINETLVPSIGYPLENLLPVAIMFCLWAAFEIIEHTDHVPHRGHRFG